MQELIFDAVENCQTSSTDLSIEEVYQIVKEKPVLIINLSEVKDTLINALRSATKGLGEESDYPEIKEKPAAKHYSIRTVHHDTILNYAELVSHLESYEDMGVCRETDYTHGYYDLNYDEFRTYIAWRTRVRAGDILPCPNGFLFLYLMELCNFIEHDDSFSTLKHIRVLADTFSSDKKKSEMIKQALFEFTTLYADIIEMTPGEECRVWRLKNSEQLKSGDYSGAYDFMIPMYTYIGRIKGVPNPFINEEDEPVLRKLFPLVLQAVNQYFLSRDIDLFNLWCGRTLSHKPHQKYVKEIVTDALMPKHAFDIGCSNPEYYISVDPRCEEPFRVLCQYQQDLDSDGTVFFDHSILLYLLNSFINEYFKFVGKQQIDDRKDDLINRPYRNPLRGDIVNAFITDSFHDTIRIAIVNSGVEPPKRNTEFFIYCTVKFKGIRGVYSYLAEDESIQAGDYVLVPLGDENAVTEGQVVEVTRCTVGDAPYPPSKTKHIISKLVE